MTLMRHGMGGGEERRPIGQDIKFMLIIPSLQEQHDNSGSCHSVTLVHLFTPVLLRGIQMNCASSCLWAFAKTVDSTWNALLLPPTDLSSPCFTAACPSGLISTSPLPRSSLCSPAVCSLSTLSLLLPWHSVYYINFACLLGPLFRDWIPRAVEL